MHMLSGRNNTNKCRSDFKACDVNTSCSLSEFCFLLHTFLHMGFLFPGFLSPLIHLTFLLTLQPSAHSHPFGKPSHFLLTLFSIELSDSLPSYLSRSIKALIKSYLIFPTKYFEFFKTM